MIKWKIQKISHLTDEIVKTRLREADFMLGLECEKFFELIEKSKVEKQYSDFDKSTA